MGTEGIGILPLLPLLPFLPFLPLEEALPLGVALPLLEVVLSLFKVALLLFEVVLLLFPPPSRINFVNSKKAN